jgi:hypothetical protein
MASNIARYAQLGKPPRKRRGPTDRDTLGEFRPVATTTPDQYDAVMALLTKRGAIDLAPMLGLVGVDA